MPTPDPALIDTDVASVLYRARLFRRVMPAGLARVVADRPLAISVITLGEASYGALSRKWSARRTTEMLAFYTDHFDVIELENRASIPFRGDCAAAVGGAQAPGLHVWSGAACDAGYMPGSLAVLRYIVLTCRNRKPTQPHLLTSHSYSRRSALRPRRVFEQEKPGRIQPDGVLLGQPVAIEYGRLRAASEALGRPVAGNDLWIAASTTANGLPLVTLNRRHFEPLTLHGLRLL